MHQLLRGSLYWGKVISLGVILGVGIQFAEAWTNPTASAPGGNIAGPLNTGVINQVKNASLGLVGNLAANMLQINGVATEGAACSSTGLVARDTGGVILSCQSGAWRKGMGGGGLGTSRMITAPTGTATTSVTCASDEVVTSCVLRNPTAVGGVYSSSISGKTCRSTTTEADFSDRLASGPLMATCVK
ncbi:MAG: shufflon system plasmid conjugative transfer pilus tip adhesin PilV [Candidatus Moranbacteria bacterium]|nr:shufflon system plasmid conjugative transfer pilus tip adhesin PilV [Candidatus Moranbacteria bacterium]MBP6034073.1 shufflon system plasmid conjugative transfer pilus tip adhesin PilV [Candidatus Moranbacteria bacterium]MBP7695825.1 shufflon system plasmid conjugative transfer pilus tip adhesin PilV [Candidatus Moranbacteria bacterium]